MTKINNKYFTFHGYNRIRERSVINEKDLKQISVRAIKNGLNFWDLPPGDLKSYVGYKIAKQGKKVKLYRGYVFIFFINSKRLITCYPIPEKHLEEYYRIKNQKNKKNVK